MNINKFAIEMHDVGRIEKLNHLTNLETFHDDVRKLTKNTHSDHSIKRWQCLSEIRYNELVILKVLHTISHDLYITLDSMINDYSMGHDVDLVKTEKKLATHDLAECLDLLNNLYIG